jgi:hypothetical protein
MTDPPPSGCQTLKQSPGVGDYCCLDDTVQTGKCPQNTTCDPNSATCKPNAGYCKEDTDCQGTALKYKGLTCNKSTNKCECIAAGRGLLCSEDTVCVPGSSPGPGPGPGPDPGWPDAFQPSPPSDWMKNFTGLCNNDASKAWFVLKCPPDQNVLGAKVAKDGTPECVTLDEWKSQGGQPGSKPWAAYSNICYHPKSS